MSRLDHFHTSLPPTPTVLPKFASILIVDDQRFDRLRLKRLINELEFETHVVEADCLETMGTMLQIDKFDLILLDYNLPDGNGLQALGAVRMDPKNRHAATIMIAGDSQTEIAIEALKRGCSDYITKDELSSASFRRATINALQKSNLSIGMEDQGSKRRHIETVLQKFSSECADEIKPVVSRMMRQLRDFRDARTLTEDQAAERYSKIENSCMRLWEFLNDLDAYEGTDLSHGIYEEPGISQQSKSGGDRDTTRAVATPKRDAFPYEANPNVGKVTPKKPARRKSIFRSDDD